jgi:zinc protease
MMTLDHSETAKEKQQQGIFTVSPCHRVTVSPYHHATASPRTALLGPDDILRCTLPNGITVLARENWSAPSIVLEGYLQAGNLDEPESLTGLASYTSSMLSRGTRRRSFAEISETVESVGASVGFGADRYTTSFSTKSLAEDLDLVLDILADELRNPAFPADHVEKVRGLRMTAIAERENDTRQMASLAFRELMFGSHPLGRNMLGTRQTNAAIQRDALTEFYATFYRPQGLVIAVVGAISAEQAVTKVAEAFGDWAGDRPARADLPPIPGLDGVRERRVAMPDKSQSDIIIGWPAMPRLDPDFDKARLANTVLGVFGMMGRLGMNVRERQGMAYYAYSQLAANKATGLWLAIAGVNPANVERAIGAMLQEAARLADERVPEDELSDCKRYMTGSLPLQMETNDGVASLLVDMEWHALGLDYVQRYINIINSLTADDIQAAAQKYLATGKYALAVAGPG